MREWSTFASLATAFGTLILAIATFVAVRAANRAARVAEYSMQIGIRPFLVPSRLEDTAQKLMWGDEHWAKLPGSGGVVETADGNVYLAMSLRNSGSGVAVIHGWHLVLEDLQQDHAHAEPDGFRRQLRDLYIPGDDVGFWQGAIRDRDDPEYRDLLAAATAPRVFAIELLYGDNEGGQRAIGRYMLAPLGEGHWLCSVVPALEPRSSGSALSLPEGSTRPGGRVASSWEP